jgi:post-segregation antitoxin (ccd killing protein)
MIESGLPQALALLLDLVSRVWHEYGHEVNATLYAIWAIAEEKVTSEQLLAAENWLLQDDHRQAISEALLGLAAEDRMGSAWKVAVALKLPCTEAVLRVALGRAGTQYDAARSLSMVPCPEVGSDLAPYAADQQNAAMCMRSAEALAAQQDRAAFWVLVGALREWDVLYRDIGFAFAESAWALDLVSECASWLTDAGEAKCLRQGAALAVGLALREVHGESRTPLVAALADAIAGDSDVANAAAIAARISGAAELFEPLKERVNLTESTAFEAIHAVAAIATSDAVGYLYQLWSDQDLYFMEAAPTTALATAIAQDFIDPASRHGEAWEKAKAWVTTAYERFRTTRGTRGETTPDGKKQYNHLSSDLAIGSALIQLVTAWDLDELTQAIAEETVGDQHGSWYSSFDQHRRWVFLARKSPRQLLEIMGCAEVRELSESNKLHLAEALLAIEDPNLGDGVRQRIVEMSIALKSDPRRKMAALIARREPDWIADVELTDDTVLLLRDIAVNVSPLTSSGILGRLTESDRRRFRTEGQRALWRRDAATQDLVNSLKQDPDPFRRLWWVTGFASVATDALIGDVSEGMEASKDQFQNSAIGYAIEAAEKRLKTDAGREDFRRRSGEEWVW